MNRFVFPLAPVLEVRRNERDLLARGLAELQDARKRLLDTRGAVVARRSALLEELRHLPAAENGLDVEGTLNRHAYAQRLSEEVVRVDTDARTIAERIETVHAELLRTNQQVEGLERLEARQRTTHLARLERQESLEREENWQARRSAQQTTS